MSEQTISAGEVGFAASVETGSPETVSSQEVIPEGWERTLRQVQLIVAETDYEEDFIPPTFDVLWTAVALTESLRGGPLPAASRVLPTPEGGIMFEWHLGRTYQQAEIPERGEIRWMKRQPGEGFRHWRETIEVPERTEADATLTTSSPSL